MNEQELLRLIRSSSLLGSGLPITDDVRRGELGQLRDLAGNTNTELSITVNDPRLHSGNWVNIPTLVKGQTGLGDIMGGLKLSDRQYEIAVTRALQRLLGGGFLPSYPSLEEAEMAARTRSDKWTPYQRGIPWF